MVFLLALIIVVMFPATFLLRQSRKTYWFLGVLLGWCLSSAAFVLFYAKTAGFSYYVNRLLFVSDFIRTALLYAPINLVQITVMQILGRSMFTVCLFGFSCAMAYRIPRRVHIIGNCVSMFLGALNIAFYLPPVYRHMATWLSSSGLNVAAAVVRLWFLAVVLFSFINLWNRYRNTSFKWFRSKQAYLNTGILAFTGFYLYVILRGPIQYSDAQNYFHLYGSFNYYNPPISPLEWGIWLVLLTVMLATSIYSFGQYSRYERQFQTDEIRLKSKMGFMHSGISILSHAVKNQLVTSGLMLGDAVKLLDTGGIDGARELIARVIAQDQGMLSRLDSLRNTFKQREMNLKRVKYQQLMSLLEEQLRAPENIRFSLDAHDPSLSLLLDVPCMAEALANIVTNAFEAIGGTQGGAVSITQYLEDGWCVIQICDNGPGMTPDCLTQIFDPFYSHKNSSRNWGIGLSFTKQVVAAHGGMIEAKSEPSKGAEFIILLPHS